MIAVDSSIAVAAFGEWHELNETARSFLDRGASIPAHALIETYSVLTGFPPPHRAAPDVVDTWIDGRFLEILAPPEAHEQREMLRTLVRAGRIGGIVYDALVALTAKRAGATLITADMRALPVYEMIGVEIERVG